MTSAAFDSMFAELEAGETTVREIRRKIYFAQQACAHTWQDTDDDADDLPWEKCTRCRSTRMKDNR
jgi:hypothetical protein